MTLICALIVTSRRSINEYGKKRVSNAKSFPCQKSGLGVPSRGVRSFLQPSFLTKPSGMILYKKILVSHSIRLFFTHHQHLASSASSFFSSIFESSPAPVAFNFPTFQLSFIIAFLFRYPRYLTTFSRCNTHQSSFLRLSPAQMSSPTVSLTQLLVPTV